MSAKILTIALVLLVVFILLKPTIKALIGIIVSSNGFDLTPKVIYGWDIWDIGMLLFIITGFQLAFQKAKISIDKPVYVYFIYGFIAWMLLSLVWSIAIYDYTASYTLKTARHLILGYFVLFLFLRLFATHENAFDFICKWLYRITYILMIVVLIQYIINKPLLYGLIISYQDALRALPVFLPFCSLFSWHILFRHISAKSIKLHESIYVLLWMAVVGITYTRGIYLATLAALLYLFIITARQRKLSTKKLITFVSIGILGLSLLAISGSIDKVIDRAASGASLAMGSKSSQTSGGADTFTGRLLLTSERFAMVASHNFLVGYGFLHEEQVPASLRGKLKYGSIIYTDYYKNLYRRGHPYTLALYSADIGWADIVVKTGIIGFCIFVIILTLILLSIFRLVKKQIPDEKLAWSTAFYLELFVLVILMFNGNPFVVNLQIPLFMLAGLIYCTNTPQNTLIEKTAITPHIKFPNIVQPKNPEKLTTLKQA